jgi:hypothetical protein
MSSESIGLLKKLSFLLLWAQKRSFPSQRALAPVAPSVQPVK